jgi:MFS family permease
MRRFGGNNGRAVTALLCVAQFVVVLDVTIVTTALPAIGRELGVTQDALQWVITAYMLCFGGFLIVGGRLADRLGGRRAFALGLAGFTLASLLCALSWSPELLIAFRALQGLAAALLVPAALALLTAIGAGGKQQERAVGVWTAAAAGGGAAGWVLGGLLTEHADWRWVFAVNVAIGLAVLPLITGVLPWQPERRSAGPDPIGAVGITAGLALIVYGLTEAGALRSEPIRPLVALVVGAGTLFAVLRRERRLANPLLPVGLLASRVRAAALAAAAVTASTSPAMYLAVIYIQDGLRLPPGTAAFYFPAFNLTAIVGAFLGPRLLDALTARWTAVLGFALTAAGCLVLATLPEVGLPAARLLTAFGLMGLGLGFASVASTAVGTDAAPTAHRGVVSGLLNSAAQLGTAVGLAVVVPVASAASAGGQPRLEGMRWGFAAAALIAVLGLGAGRLLSRSAAEPHDRRAVQPDSPRHRRVPAAS